MALLIQHYKILFQKKLRASSLVEMLVATVIIVLIFAVASLTLNNVFKSTIQNNTDAISTQLNYLEYQYRNKQITIPFSDEFQNWEISVQKITESNESYISFDATNKKYKKTVSKKIIDVSK